MKNTIIILLLLIAVSCEEDFPTDTPNTPSGNVKIDAGQDLNVVLPMRSTIEPTITITNPGNISLNIKWRQLKGIEVKVDANQIRLFEEGLYSFEISVGSGAHVFDSDTLNINVVLQTSCIPAKHINLSKTVISKITTWDNKIQPVVILEDKVLFASLFQYDPTGYDASWDITFHKFNLTDLSWYHSNGLMEPKDELAHARSGNSIFFAGGTMPVPTATVEVYNAANDKWSQLTLSSARSRIGMAAGGNKVLFAGGINKSGQEVSTIDIYDTSTKTWSITNLKEPKKDISAIVINNKAYFVGGRIGEAPVSTVEVYDIASGAMSSFNLRTERYKPILQSFDNKLFVGGGIKGANVFEYESEIIELNTGSRNYSCMSEYAFASSALSSVWHNNRLFVLNPQSPRGTIEIYDPASNSWLIHTEDLRGNAKNIALFKSGSSLYLFEVSYEESNPVNHKFVYTIYKVS